MNILALDPAKLCGFSHTSGERGVWDLGESKFSLLRLHDRIKSVLGENRTDIIAAENAQQGSHNFYIQGVHAEYRAIISLCAQQAGAEFVLVNPTSLKAWAAHSGRAKKADMKRWAEIHYGVRIDDDNECDAFLIMQYVLAGQHLRALPAKVVKKRDKVRRKKEARFVLKDLLFRRNTCVK